MLLRGSLSARLRLQGGLESPELTKTLLGFCRLGLAPEDRVFLRHFRISLTEAGCWLASVYLRHLWIQWTLHILPSPGDGWQRLCLRQTEPVRASALLADSEASDFVRYSCNSSTGFLLWLLRYPCAFILVFRRVHVTSRAYGTGRAS